MKTKLLAYIKAHQNAGIYTIAGFLSKGISFLVWPYFTHVISSADLGRLGNFMAIITFLYPVVSLGFLQIMSVQYYSASIGDRRRIINNGIQTSFFLAAVLALIVIGLNVMNIGVFEIDPSLYLWIPIILFLNILFDLCTTIERFENKPNRFVAWMIVKIVIEIGLSIGLIYFFNYGYEARVYGLLIAYFVPTIIFMYWYQKRIGFQFIYAPNLISQNIKYGFVGMVQFIGVFVLMSSDRFFITHYIDVSEAGMYSVAVTFASIQIVFISAVLAYFTPKLYQDLSANIEMSKILRTHLRPFILWNLCLWGLLTILVPLTYHWMINPIYIDGMPIFFVLHFNTLLWGLVAFLTNLLVWRRDFKQLNFGIIIAIIIYIGAMVAIGKNLTLTFAPMIQLMSIGTLLIVFSVHLWFKRRKFNIQ